ncbi:MAG: hypothetical protein ACYC3S_05085 [Chloroflexota bacterium]
MQGREVAVLAGAVILVVLLLAFLGGGTMMGPGMMGWVGYGPWGGIMMLLFWLVIVGGVVLLGVWLLR